MAKKTRTISDEPVTLNESAFSLYKAKGTGLWTVIKIAFDQVSESVGDVEVLVEEISREEAEHRLRIIIANNLL